MASYGYEISIVPADHLGLALLTFSCDKTWITNHNFQMQLLISCQQSCQPIRNHIRKSWLVNHDFILGLVALTPGHSNEQDWEVPCMDRSAMHYGDVIMGEIASQITSSAIVYSTVYSDADQRKHQSSASLAFVREIHRGPVNSLHKWPVTRKMFPFEDVIMVRSYITHVSNIKDAVYVLILCWYVTWFVGLLLWSIWLYLISFCHRPFISQSPRKYIYWYM